MISATGSTTGLQHRLDRLHARVRANALLQRFTILTRILLAIGFVPPALVKVRGERFTVMPIETPVGFFFEAMYQTGAYWQFIGWAQIVGGILLLMPRTATLGAVVFFPIILNIFVITVSLGFIGTPVVTGLMLLACLYLLCWDYDRLKLVIFPPQAGLSVAPAPVAAGGVRTAELAAYALMTASGMVTMLATRSFVPMAWVPACLAVGLLGGLLLAASMLVEFRGRRMLRAEPA